jgi:hypothetical protein
MALRKGGMKSLVDNNRPAAVDGLTGAEDPSDGGEPLMLLSGVKHVR